MASVEFNFSTLTDLHTALGNLQCHSKPPASHDLKYNKPLRELASRFRPFVTPTSLCNAIELSSGNYRDLVLVLLEPTNGASYLTPNEMFAQSKTLQWVDRILLQSSGGVRTWENTRILDIRPFRNADWRGEDDDFERSEWDNMAYRAFEAMIRLAKPDVILVCQCQTAECPKGGLARKLCSSVESAGDLRLLDIHGQQTVVVNGFHPSWLWYKKEHNDRNKDLDPQNDSGNEEMSQRERLAPLREALLEFAFLAAINAAAGRRITGSGQYNLSHCALYGPIPRLKIIEDRNYKIVSAEMTYEWISRAFVARPKLIEMAKQALDWAEQKAKRRALKEFLLVLSIRTLN